MMAAYETDVVVIAAGPSGLAAAVQAAEDGAKVLVVEKSQLSGERPTWEWGLWGSVQSIRSIRCMN